MGNGRGDDRAQLSSAAIDGLRASSRERTYGENEAVVRKGETGTSFYVVVSGEVEIRLQAEDGRTLPLTRLGPGATFGEMALLRNEPVSADVVAVRPATLMVCPAENFRRALAECEPLRTELMARLADDLHNTTSEAWNFFQKADALRLLIRCENQPGPLVRKSSKMRSVDRSLERAAEGTDPVLILGEPGTGKLYAARILHQRAHTGDAPLIIVDCRRVRSGDAGKLLLGGGDDRDAGTVSTRPGALQLARGGTLILRHVDALDGRIQERLAGAIAGRVENPTRLIATVRHEGKSLPDLHPSLAAALEKTTVVMPPLRDRRKDVVELAGVFAEEIEPEGGVRFHADARRALVTLEFDHHHARQLRESVEVALLCADGPEIGAEHLFSGMATEAGPPGLDLRRLLQRSRLFRMGPLTLSRAAVFIGFALVIAVCLTAGSSTLGRWSNGFIWGVWEPVVFGLFLLVGSVWCTVCPLSTAGRLSQKVFGLRRSPPAWLKRHGVWLAVFGFFAIVAAELIFHMGDNPAGSGLLLLALVLASVAFCVVYSREVWCRYVCPLGALASGLAPAALLEVGARPGLCSSTCTTHNCYKGSDTRSGCTVFHHPLNSSESHQCKLCFDCLKTCPHESTRVYLRPPLAGLWRLDGGSLALAPFATAVFLLTLVLLAAQSRPDLAGPLPLIAAGVGAILLGALLHRILPRALVRSSDADNGHNHPGVSVQAAFALLVLGWGPLMAYQVANIPDLDTVRFAAAAGSVWSAFLPDVGLSLVKVLQATVLVAAAAAAGLGLAGAYFLARRRGARLVTVGWLGLGGLFVGYLTVALMVVS